MSEWRTVIRWLHTVSGEKGTIEDTSELPHAILLELTNKGARLKINGCMAFGNPPIVDPIAKTIEYCLELFPFELTPQDPR